MKARHAIGITINGNEVRAAFLTLVRGKARIKALESIKLEDTLENLENEGSEAINDLENAFDIQEPRHEQDDEENEDFSSHSSKDKNVSLVYTLLDKFQNLKSYVAINTPHLTVKYDYLDSDQIPGKKKGGFFKGKVDIWDGGQEDNSRRSVYLPISDNKHLEVNYEYHPSSIELLEEVNQFRSSNLNLVLMDTNELALVDLVKEIYKFEKDDITAIVYIEQDFSRVIFLKGREIYHITPIVHKGSMSNDVLEVIYSKMIFAQDHYFIPEFTKILVAGHSSRLKAKYYFRQKFPSAITGYLNSKKIESDLRFKDRGLLFSRYAVPIALAWKALQKNIIKSKSNLLPDYILESKTIPKLALHGYVLLIFMAATAFFFSWALVKKNIEIAAVENDVKQMRTQIKNNASLTNRVHSFDDKIISLERRITLVDSFSKGYDETISFLRKLNEGVGKTRDIWITDLRKNEQSINIVGMALQRNKIPQLVREIGGANLKKQTRANFNGRDIYAFQIEKKLDEEEKGKVFDFMTFFSRKSNNGRNGEGNGRQPQIGSTAKNGVNRHSTNGHSLNYAYGVQIGQFRSQLEAKKKSSKYKSKGYPVRISKISAKSNQNKYTIIVGQYGTLENAKQLLHNLGRTSSGQANKVVKYKVKSS